MKAKPGISCIISIYVNVSKDTCVRVYFCSQLTGTDNCHPLNLQYGSFHRGVIDVIGDARRYRYHGPRAERENRLFDLLSIPADYVGHRHKYS